MESLTLVLTDQHGVEVKSWSSSQGPVAIGRGSRSSSSLTGSTHSGLFRTEGTAVMSQNHATLTWAGSYAFLSDTASTNGTFLTHADDEEQHKLKHGTSYRLKEGDRITFGKVVAGPSSSKASSYKPLTVTVSLRKSLASAPMSQRPASAVAPDVARSRTVTHFTEIVELLSSDDEDHTPMHHGSRRSSLPTKRPAGRFGFTESELIVSGDDDGSDIICDNDEDSDHSRASEYIYESKPAENTPEAWDAGSYWGQLQQEAMQSDLPSLRRTSSSSQEVGREKFPEQSDDTSSKELPEPSFERGPFVEMPDKDDAASSAASSPWSPLIPAEEQPVRATRRRRHRSTSKEDPTVVSARLPSPVSPEQPPQKPLVTHLSASLDQAMHDSPLVDQEACSSSPDLCSRWSPPPRAFDPSGDPSVQYFAKLASESFDAEEQASSHLPSPVASLEEEQHRENPVENAAAEALSVVDEEQLRNLDAVPATSSERISRAASPDRPCSPSPEELEALHFSLQSSQARKDLWEASTEVRRELDVEYGAGFVEHEKGDEGEKDPWLDEKENEAIDEVDRDQFDEPREDDDALEVDFEEELDDFGDEDLDVEIIAEDIVSEESVAGEAGEGQSLEVLETVEEVQVEQVVHIATNGFAVASDTTAPLELDAATSYASPETPPAALLGVKRPISVVEDAPSGPDGDVLDSTRYTSLIQFDAFSSSTLSDLGAVANASAQTSRPLAPLPRRASSVKRATALVATGIVVGMVATIAGLGALESGFETLA